MKKTVSFFLLVLLSLFSTAFSTFQQNNELVEALKANNTRVIILCNFQGTNNLLDIVTSSRSPGYELTNAGITELQDTSVALSRQNIKRIYTAPAYRAQQTTNFLGKSFNLLPSQLIIDTRLSMQNFGSADGEDYDIYKLRYTSMQDMLENTPPNGESGFSVSQRSENLLWNLVDYPNQTILVVSHAFNFCHLSKILSGKYGTVPLPGTYVVFDFNAPKPKPLANKC